MSILIIFYSLQSIVDRLRYTNNNFTNDRCSIPMDMAVVHSPHRFNLQATIDHHGPSTYSMHNTFVNWCKKLYCNDSKVNEFEMMITRLLLMWWCINRLRNVFWTKTGGWEFWLLTWCRKLWIGWCVSSWRPWFWLVYSINYIHTLHYSCMLSDWNKPFLPF